MHREIPYNYTSFSDKEIVCRLLDQSAWQLIEKLRQGRQTGRSAKMLYEILGDIWIVRRNPYLQEDLLKNPKRLNALIEALNHRVSQIIKRSTTADIRVDKLIAGAKKTIADFEIFLLDLKQDQQRIQTALLKITSANNIRLDALSRSSHSTDASDWRVEYPLVVITPDTELEVAQLVKACIKLELTIIARGGGTGYTGSGIPLSTKTAIINTEKLLHLGKVKQIDGISCVGVGAGVVTRRVAEVAQKSGLVFAVDPTSQDACTIGGNIAMNAGGKKAVRWGTTIDNLLSWKMVMPDGQWLEVRRLNHNMDKIQLIKTVEFELNYLDTDAKTVLLSKPLNIDSKDMRQSGLGKDVTNKFLSGLPGVQKEGCDGLITSAQFVLHQNNPHLGTLCLEFFGAKMHRAVSAIVAIKQSIDDNPETDLIGLEHLDSRYIKAVGYTTKSNNVNLPKMVLLLDVGANTPKALADIATTVINITKVRGGEGFIAQNPQQRRAFWKDRANTAAIASHTNAFKINEDVVIPLDKLADYNDEIDRINIGLSLENKLKIAQDIQTYILSLSSDKGIFQEKWKLAKPIIEQIISTWQQTLSTLKQLDTFDAIQDERVDLSLYKTLLKPLFKIYVGDQFESVRHTLTDIQKTYKNIRLFVATHMHAGDGNVHTNIPVHSHLPDMLAKAEQVVDEIMSITTRLGGVISGEHGIGLTKFAYLSQTYKDEFASYKSQIDPQGNFNKGKLLAGSGLDDAYTPSLRLLEKEALILENSEMGEINQMTKSCLRCGKCKPVCTTHIPEANLLYSPRDKIIGSNLIIEAFLYEEQTRRGVSLAHFDELDDIADHCTICHKCHAPCPVNIDFGDVSMKMRHILKKHGKKRSNVATKASMAFLNMTSAWQIKLSKSVLNITYAAQRLAHKLTKPLHQKPPNSTLGVPKFSTQIITLLDKPLPTDTGLKPFRQLLDIEASHEVPVLYNPNNHLVGEEVRTIMYFPGCGSERLFSQIGLATLALLYSQGVRIVLPPGYLCCGYPQRASGDFEKAKKITTDNKVLMHRMSNTLNYLDINDIITSCGTCIDQLFDYDLGQIFQDTRLLDIHEYLLEMEVKLKPNTKKYLYHQPCHDPIKSGDSNQIINELMGVEALNNDRCCGESGTFAVARPDIAKQVKFKKQNQIQQDLTQLINKPKVAKTDKEQVIMLTTCPACRQGLARYEDNTGVSSQYPIEIMAQQLLGKNWQTDFIEHVKIEKVLL